ncbi:hypothetical protein P3T36_001010 [Kitasatospora sp. MAP12-15]|uniref:hypothetical protein n=1 Tax=unclassified Kitasatospora TaxID=2633591 RepID=UPI0024747D6B|nr:hypothetical protein [Kitasatospora sp. MAP12-44]MDH6114658.1 hypothetical protein [Kitasatospora sp. MAP12-44]
MSRRATRRRQNSSRQSGDRLPYLLSLPARKNIRWRFIATVMVATMGLYLLTMLAAPPMPPSKAPTPGSSSVAPQPPDDQNA